MWARGIKRPPHKIKVKAVKEKDIVKVELVDYSTKLKFKKLREIKNEEVAKGKKKKVVEKVEEPKTEEQKKEESEKKEEESEKKAAIVEEGQMIGKASAKQMKHMVGGKKTQKTHPVRKALAK